MTRPTKHSANQRALDIFFKGSDHKVSYQRLKERLDEIKAHPEHHRVLVDTQGAMVLLELPYTALTALKKKNPPPHPFKVPSVPEPPKRPRGRPRADAPVFQAVKRPRGKPAALASIAELLAWFKALEKEGHLKSKAGGWLPPDYLIGRTHADLPFHVRHDPLGNRTVIERVLIGAGAIYDAIERQGAFIGFMPLTDALRMPWSDPALRHEWARAYTARVQQDADALLAEVVNAAVVDATDDRPLPSRPIRRP